MLTCVLPLWFFESVRSTVIVCFLFEKPFVFRLLLGLWLFLVTELTMLT